MPPTNDTGYEIIVGPDVNGDHFSVAPDEDYDLPEPPKGVSVEDTPAPVEETPSEAADGGLSVVKNDPGTGQKPDEVDPSQGTPPSGDKQDPPGETPPAGNDTEGAQA
jgi:hypothetical protein